MLIPGARPVVLLSAAAAVSAGLALPHGRDDTAPTARPAGFPPLSIHPWSWSLRLDGAETIQVRSRHCPKDHPRKVGSFFYRTVRVTNGKVERHSATGSICAK